MGDSTPNTHANLVALNEGRVYKLLRAIRMVLPKSLVTVFSVTLVGLLPSQRSLYTTFLCLRVVRYWRMFINFLPKQTEKCPVLFFDFQLPMFLLRTGPAADVCHALSARVRGLTLSPASPRDQKTIEYSLQSGSNQDRSPFPPPAVQNAIVQGNDFSAFLPPLFPSHCYCQHAYTLTTKPALWASECACVCVCVCVREREPQIHPLILHEPRRKVIRVSDQSSIEG